jgi:hypothetical protein
VANYRVLFLRQANLVDGGVTGDREVQEYIVQLERDGVFAAEWIGTIDSVTLFTLASNDIPRFHHNAVKVVANHAKSDVEADADLGVSCMVRLTLAEVFELESNSQSGDWTTGDVVLEFDQ